MYNEWLAAAETALSQNISSFAVLPISELLKADESRQRPLRLAP
jgi:hypothetical protein